MHVRFICPQTPWVGRDKLSRRFDGRNGSSGNRLRGVCPLAFRPSNLRLFRFQDLGGSSYGDSSRGRAFRYSAGWLAADETRGREVIQDRSTDDRAMGQERPTAQTDSAESGASLFSASGRGTASRAGGSACRQRVIEPAWRGPKCRAGLERSEAREHGTNWSSRAQVGRERPSKLDGRR